MSKLQNFLAENVKLHEEWHRSYDDCDGFIFDGATDPELWLNGKERILCFLKEAHGGGIWNHADAIRDCGGLLRVGWPANQATHYRILEWLYAITSSLGEKPLDVESDRSSGYPEGKAIMLRSSWINIKKAKGISSSSAHNLRGVVEKDLLFLKRQLELLSPRLILCCGTFSLMCDLLFPSHEKIPGTTCSYKSGDLVVIDYRHPARASRESYIPLIEETKRIKMAGLLG